jgi:hypothetical protein
VHRWDDAAVEVLVVVVARANRRHWTDQGTTRILEGVQVSDHDRSTAHFSCQVLTTM